MKGNDPVARISTSSRRLTNASSRNAHRVRTSTFNNVCHSRVNWLVRHQDDCSTAPRARVR
jgi:hypothetical protein